LQYFDIVLPSGAVADWEERNSYELLIRPSLFESEFFICDSYLGFRQLGYKEVVFLSD